MKHQLFIDTTRNSEYYSKIEKWSASKYATEVFEQYIYEIVKDFKPARIELNGLDF